MSHGLIPKTPCQHSFWKEIGKTGKNLTNLDRKLTPSFRTRRRAIFLDTCLGKLTTNFECTGHLENQYARCKIKTVHFRLYFKGIFILLNRWNTVSNLHFQCWFSRCPVYKLSAGHDFCLASRLRSGLLRPWKGQQLFLCNTWQFFPHRETQLHACITAQLVDKENLTALCTGTIMPCWMSDMTNFWTSLLNC